MSIVAPILPDPDDVPLFDGYEPPAGPPAKPTDGLSAGRRLTLRQAQNITEGVHPLTRGPLHESATRDAGASDGKALPFRCGSCYFRDSVHYRDKHFGKCWFPGSRSPEELRRFGYPRVTHGPATDVRAWWPACTDYSAGDALSPDAARSIPEGDA